MSTTAQHVGRASQRATRAVLVAGLVGSLLIALAIAVSAIATVAQTLSTGTVHRTLDLRAPLPEGAAAGPGVELVTGSFERASVEVAEVSGRVLGLHVASTSIQALVALMLAATVGVLALRLLRSRPLAHRLGLSIALAGGIVMVGSLLAVGLDAAASLLLVDELNAPLAGPDGFWPHSASVEPAGIVIGFALMLVALVVEQGEALQRDTEGLI